MKPRVTIHAMILLLGLFISFFMAWGVQKIVIASSQQEFIKDASRYASLMEIGVNIKLNKLIAVHGFIEAFGGVTSYEFNKFVKEIKHGSTVDGVIQWLPRLSFSEIEEISHGGDKPFAFKISTPPLMVGRVYANSLDYYPVRYSFPAISHSYPFASDDLLAKQIEGALQRARDSGLPSVLFHTHEAVDMPHPYDMDVFLPIYQEAAANDTVEARQKNILGFVRNRSDIGLELEALIQTNFTVPGGIDFFLFGQINSDQRGRIFDHFSRTRVDQPQITHVTESALQEKFHFSKMVPIADQNLNIVLLPVNLMAYSGFQQWYPLFILLCGSVITVFATFYAHIFVQKSAKIQMLAEEKTAALEESQERFLKLLASEQLYHSVTESTQNGILVVDSRGSVLSTNTRFREMWQIPESIVAAGKDDELLGFVLNQLENPELFLNRVRELYGSEIIDEDILNFKDGRIFDRYSAPLSGSDGMGGRVWIFTDITKRKVDEEALRIYAEELSFFYNLPFIGMAILSPETKRWEVVNNYLCQMVGYSCEELAQLTWVEITHPDDLDADRGHFQQVMQGRSDGYVMDKRFLHKDGQIISTIVNVYAIRKPDGQVDRIFATVLDITERKRLEKTLRSNEQLLQEVLNNVPALVFMKDVQGRYLFNNHRYEETFHLTSQALLGKTDHDVFPAEVAAIFEANDLLALASTTPVHADETVSHADGMHHYISVRFPMLNEEGWPYAVCGIATDITARKRAEAALLENEQRLLEITATLAEGLYVIDLQRRITFVNPATVAMLGWREEEMLGQVSHDLFHHTRADGTPYPLSACPLCGVLNQRSVVTQEEECFWRRDGGCFPVAMIASPIIRNGDIRGVVVAFRDITQRKLAEEQLRQAVEKAEAATLAKSDFLSAMSHEIRTPMNVVLGMSGVLLETDLDQDQRRYVEMMHRSGEALLAILNDILDFSRIESGRFTLVYLPFSPMELVEETARLMSISAEQKGFPLVTEIAPGTPPAMLGDDGRVRQVLVNLLGNAIKFTDHGQITMRLAPHPQEPSSLLFTIVDTGIGIAPHSLARIFDRFTQANEGIARRYGGTGLGLAISGRLVELMGGRLWAESQPGQGSTFSFTLPVRAAKLLTSPKMAVEQITGEETKDLRILLVEDSEENQVIIKIYLKNTTHLLAVVSDGLAAVKRVREEAFDLVLMDIEMPNMDGYAATRAIRQWEQEEGAPPLVIIALTAHASLAWKEKSLAAGCDDHLTKPIKKQYLLDVLDRHARVNHEDEKL